MDSVKTTPDFTKYLLYILLFSSSEDLNLRYSAGLLLKNSINQTSVSQCGQYLMENILNGLSDSNKMIRNITGSVITSLFFVTGVKEWPQLLPQLIQLVESSSNSSTKESSISALEKICEDNGQKLIDEDYNGSKPLEFLLPKFHNFTTSNNNQIKKSGISCINHFIALRSDIILNNLDTILQRLFDLASSNSNDDIKRQIFLTFTTLLEIKPESLQPSIEGIINYSCRTIKEFKNSNEGLSLDACKTLLALSESDSNKLNPSLIIPLLDEIIPLLLDSMIYSDEDILILKDDNNDADEDDKAEDVRPTNAKSKDSHNSNKNTSNGNSSKDETNDDDDDGNDDDSDEDEELDELTQWNLRKCSAASLDALSKKLPNEVLRTALPLLEQRFSNDTSYEWKQKEAALLAFGAIASGSSDITNNHLPTLIPFFVQTLQDNESLVRQMACWTISRCSEWLANEVAYKRSCSNYFQPVLESLIKCGTDRNKKVQESACSSLNQLIDKINDETLLPYIDLLIKHFSKCFSIYKTKNLIILYDMVQSFVERIGSNELNKKSEYILLLVPPLISKWSIMNYGDRDLWPLLECLSSIASSSGNSFAPYAITVYQNSISILENCIIQDQQSLQDENVQPPERDFIITSIDLIDGLVQGLKNHSVEVIQSVQLNSIPVTIDDKQHGSSLMELILYCLQDPDEEVRQSVYSLIGDLTINVFDPIVSHYSQQLVYAIINETDMKSMKPSPVCSNATWALGEISIRMGSNFSPFVESTLNVLLPILIDFNGSESVLQNVSITIGRIGINCPDLLSQHLTKYFNKWCEAIYELDEDTEKDEAFQGLCNIIMNNPESLTGNGIDDLVLFIDVVGSYENPSDKLKNEINKVLQGFKQYTASEWEGIMSRVRDDFRNSIRKKYNL